MTFDNEDIRLNYRIISRSQYNNVPRGRTTAESAQSPQAMQDCRLSQQPSSPQERQLSQYGCQTLWGTLAPLHTEPESNSKLEPMEIPSESMIIPQALGEGKRTSEASTRPF